MRPSKLIMSGGQISGSLGIRAVLPFMENFVEFSSPSPLFANSKAGDAACWEIANEVWVQFAPQTWNFFVSELFEEMVECWNEQYADDKYSSLRGEINSYHEYAWALKDEVAKIKDMPGCPENIAEFAGSLVERVDKKFQADYDATQTEVRSLRKEVERLEKIVGGKA